MHNHAATIPAYPVRTRTPGLSRVAVVALGVGVAVWGAMSPQFRDSEGALRAAACVPFAAGFAIALVGASLATPWRRAAAWLALAAVGQSCALQLIDAGQRLRYQHYKSPADLWVPGNRLLVAVLLVQAVAVLAGMRPLWRPCLRWVRARLGAVPLMGIAVLTVFSAAAVARDVRLFAFQAALACAVELLALLNIVVAAVAAPAFDVRRCLRRWPLSRVTAFGALWVLVLTAALNLFVYSRHPHVPDEVSYLLQARYLAHGMLAMPAPPAPRAFDLDLMTYEPARWYSPFPPGWPAALAIGVRLGVEWLVNPLLAALGVFGVCLLFREWYGGEAAALAVLAVAVSPWYLFMGMSFMSHILVLDLALLAGWAASVARRKGSWRWALGAGLAIGAASVVRPLDGVILAVLAGLWMLGARRRVLLAGALAAGAAAAGLVSLPYNRALTGHWLKFPVDDYFDRYYHPGVNALGFGADRGLNWGIDPFPGHGLRDVVVNAQLNASSVNADFLGWACGSLLLAGAGVFALRAGRRDWRMLAVIAAVVGAYSLYWFSGGPDFGARYWFLILIPCVALTLRGLETLDTDGRATMAAAALAVLAVVNYLPWRATDKYHHYLRMRPDVRELAWRHGFGRSVVLIRGERHPDYASAAVYNPLDLSAAAPVYAWERDDQARDEALRAYPGRPLWILNGPSITGQGFEIVAGPVRREGF